MFNNKISLKMVVHPYNATQTLYMELRKSIWKSKWFIKCKKTYNQIMYENFC